MCIRVTVQKKESVRLLMDKRLANVTAAHLIRAQFMLLVCHKHMLQLKMELTC